MAGNAYRGIEQSTTYPVKNPSGDCEGETEGKTDEHELIQVRHRTNGVGNLGGRKGKIEEHDRSDEFS